MKAFLRMLEQYGWHIECIFIQQPVDMLAYTERKQTGIIILDIRLYSVGDRFQDVIDILKADPTAKIIGVTANYEENVSETLKGLGASGYFFRNMPPKKIMNVISSVAMGKYCFPLMRHGSYLNRAIAKEFVRRYILGAFSHQEHCDFVEWTRTGADDEDLETVCEEYEHNDPKPPARFRLPSAVWETTLETKLAKADIIPGGTIVRRVRAIPGRLLLVGAVSVLVLVFGGSLLFRSLKHHNRAGLSGEWRTVAVSSGKERDCLLPDGTHVVLDSSSTIKYPLNMEEERTVVLSGEARFDVAPDTRRPFRVLTRDVIVGVLGTSFNVQNYPEDSFCRVAVREGAVQVILGDERATLRAGERAEVKRTRPHGQTIVVTSGINTGSDKGITKDLIQFRDANINTVLHGLSRAYGVEIYLQGPGTSTRFYGSFRRNDPIEEVLRRLHLVVLRKISTAGQDSNLIVVTAAIGKADSSN